MSRLTQYQQAEGGIPYVVPVAGATGQDALQRLAELEGVLTRFIARHRICCEEDIYQSDRVMEDAPDLVCELYRIHGGYEA